MRKSKLVVLCSYSEASPTVLKEALITGTSFLSTDVGDAKMLSEVFKGCLVVPELDENFVSAAENLAQTHNPNFAKYAENCGALGIRVTQIEELEGALEKIKIHNGPALLEVITDVNLI